MDEQGHCRNESEIWSVSTGVTCYQKRCVRTDTGTKVKFEIIFTVIDNIQLWPSREVNNYGYQLLMKDITVLLYYHTISWVSVRVMVLNASSNNISVISGRSVLLVEETRILN
jgi:hypothetical protein